MSLHELLSSPVLMGTRHLATPAVSKGADIILQDRGRVWQTCTGSQDLQQTTHPGCLLLVQHHGPPHLLTELAHKVAAACPHYHGMQNPGKQVCTSLHAGRAVHWHMTSHNQSSELAGPWRPCGGALTVQESESDALAWAYVADLPRKMDFPVWAWKKLRRTCGSRASASCKPLWQCPVHSSICSC